MCDFAQTPDATSLRSAVLEAFEHSNLTSLEPSITSRIASLQREVSPWSIKYISEEQEWLQALLDKADKEDILRRIPLTLVDPKLGVLLLPLVMTLESPEPLNLGRGVLECGLFPHFGKPPRLLLELEQSGTRSQIDVVCRYVYYCVERYELSAIDAWQGFWNTYCHNLNNSSGGVTV
jgi:hypothetical protein